MNIPALLAVLALATGEPPPDPGEEAEPSAPASSLPEGASVRTGTRHAVSLGWHATTFFSDEGSQYTFHSGSLGYQGSWGSNRPFVHLAWLLPLQARQDGVVYPTSSYYKRRVGGDVLLGWQWRFAPFEGVEGEAGPGLHTNLIWLPAKPGYRDFVAMPMGVGAQGVLRWTSRAHAFARPVVLGVYASAAYDIHDPLHPYDLAHGFAVRAGLAASLGREP